MKIARTIRYNCIKQRITIYLISMKSALQSIKDQYQIVNCISFEDKQLKRDNKSRNEALLT